MTTTAFVLGVIGAATGVAALVRTELMYRALQGATLTPELRELLRGLREALRTAVAVGPPSAARFLEQFWEPMTRLDELRPGVRDRRLRRDISATLGALEEMFKVLPAARLDVDGSPNPTDDEVERLEQAREQARVGARAATNALRRLSKLQSTGG